MRLRPTIKGSNLGLSLRIEIIGRRGEGEREGRRGVSSFYDFNLVGLIWFGCFYWMKGLLSSELTTHESIHRLPNEIKAKLHNTTYIDYTTHY